MATFNITTMPELSAKIEEEIMDSTFSKLSSRMLRDDARTTPLDIPVEGIDETTTEYVEEDEIFYSSSLPCEPSSLSLASDAMSLLSSSLSSKVELEVASNTLRQWKRSLSADSHAYQPWDFSEVSNAVDNTALKLSEGKIQADLPDRTGVSGTYFFRSVDSSMNIFGVFKPVDEEPCLEDGESWDAEQRSSSLLKYIRHAFHSGEGAYKEEAAYLLDHDRLAGVPQTTIARCDITYGESGTKRTKTGAFQVYVDNVGDADDYGPGVYDDEDVRRIAMFDIRTLNCDRHAGNILICENQRAVSNMRKSYRLVPIDHGYILPDRIVACPWPAWMDWPQVREPLSESMKEYVARLDSNHDSFVLGDELKSALKPGSLLSLQISSILLQKGVQEGLTLYDIGKLVFTRDPKESTFLEKAWNEAYSVGFARQVRQNDEPASGDQFSFINVADDGVVLFPETEDFIVRYVRRLINKKLQSLARADPGLERIRSTPELTTMASPAKPSRKRCARGFLEHTLSLQGDLIAKEMSPISDFQMSDSEVLQHGFS